MIITFHRVVACLLFMLLVHSGSTLADHAATEPSDGTVRSFLWVKEPVPIPEISIKDEEGKALPLSELKGKVVLLNLWASWCPPCIKELPALERFRKRLEGQDFSVVAVSLDNDPRLAKRMLRSELNLKDLELYTDPDKNLGAFFPIDVLPATFLINKQGEVLGMLRSYVDWDDPVAEQLILALKNGEPLERLRAGSYIEHN